MGPNFWPQVSLLGQPLILANGASPAFTTARSLVRIVNPLPTTVEFVLALMLAIAG